jgi:hypothetical protein
MPQGDAHACGVADLHGREPATDIVVPGLGESLDMPESGFMAGIGMKPGYGKRVAQSVDGPGQQGHRLLCQGEHGLIGVAAPDGVPERGRKVEKQAHCDIASGVTKALVDARVDSAAATIIDPRTQGPVEVQLGPVLLAAQSLAVLGLDLVEDVRQASRQRGILL